ERFGQLARDEFMRIYRVLHHEIGMSPKATEKFLAKGMLINTVLGMRLTDVMKTDPDIQGFLACTFTQEEAESLAELAKHHTPLPPAARGRTSS
ncbi:MAG: TetR/AcrR family transcriptional regulator, partial [Rothia aeria]